MMLTLCIAVAILGHIQAFTHEDANKYIERVLNNRFQVEAEYNRLDPHKFDDITVPIKFTPQIKGNITLSKSILFHLSKVRRSADCTVPFWQSANVTFTCFLRFDHLRFNYTASLDYLKINIGLYPHVAVQGTNVTIQVTSSPQEDVPSLRMMFVTYVGSMNVTANMIVIGNSAEIVGPALRDTLVERSNQALFRVLHGRFKQALSYSIYKTPVEFAG